MLVLSTCCVPRNNKERWPWNIPMKILYWAEIYASALFTWDSSEVHLETNQTSKMELFVNIVNSWKPSTISTKSSILDVRLGFKYASGQVSTYEISVYQLTTVLACNIHQFIEVSNKINDFNKNWIKRLLKKLANMDKYFLPLPWMRKRKNNYQFFLTQNSKFSEVLLPLPPVRDSHWRQSVKKDVLKNFTKFTGKHLCWSLFLIKLQACGDCFLPGAGCCAPTSFLVC